MSAQEHRQRLERNRRENGKAIKAANRVSERLAGTPERAERMAKRVIKEVDRATRRSKRSV